MAPKGAWTRINRRKSSDYRRRPTGCSYESMSDRTHRSPSLFTLSTILLVLSGMIAPLRASANDLQRQTSTHRIGQRPQRIRSAQRRVARPTRVATQTSAAVDAASLSEGARVTFARTIGNLKQAAARARARNPRAMVITRLSTNPGVHYEEALRMGADLSPNITRVDVDIPGEPPFSVRDLSTSDAQALQEVFSAQVGLPASRVVSPEQRVAALAELEARIDQTGAQVPNAPQIAGQPVPRTRSAMSRISRLAPGARLAVVAAIRAIRGALRVRPSLNRAGIQITFEEKPGELVLKIGGEFSAAGDAMYTSNYSVPLTDSTRASTVQHTLNAVLSDLDGRISH